MSSSSLNMRSINNERNNREMKRRVVGNKTRIEERVRKDRTKRLGVINNTPSALNGDKEKGDEIIEAADITSSSATAMPGTDKSDNTEVLTTVDIEEEGDGSHECMFSFTIEAKLTSEACEKWMGLRDSIPETIDGRTKKRLGYPFFSYVFLKEQAVRTEPPLYPKGTFSYTCSSSVLVDEKFLISKLKTFPVTYHSVEVCETYKSKTRGIKGKRRGGVSMPQKDVSHRLVESILHVDIVPLFTSNSLSMKTIFKVNSPQGIAPPPELEELVISVSVNEPLLSAIQRKRLNPLTISVISAHNLPLHRASSFDEMHSKFNPVYAKFNFFDSQKSLKDVITAPYQQSKNITWNYDHVLFAGLLDSKSLENYLTNFPLRIELHDQDRIVLAPRIKLRGIKDGQTQDGVSLSNDQENNNNNNNNNNSNVSGSGTGVGTGAVGILGEGLGCGGVGNLSGSSVSGSNSTTTITNTAITNTNTANTTNTTNSGIASVGCGYEENNSVISGVGVTNEQSKDNVRPQGVSTRGLSTTGFGADDNNNNSPTLSSQSNIQPTFPSGIKFENHNPVDTYFSLTTADTHNSFGVAQCDLSPLCNGKTTFLKFKSPILPLCVQTMDANADSTGANLRDNVALVRPGQYVEAGSFLKVRVSLTHPLIFDPKELPFSRAVFIFRGKDRRGASSVLIETVKSLNSKALGFGDLGASGIEAALSTCQLSEGQPDDKKNKDIITGFALIDSVQSIFVLEGLAEGAFKRMEEEFIPESWRRDPKFKILWNRKLNFAGPRLYSSFGATIRKVVLRQSLKKILCSKEMYIRSQLPQLLLSSLQKISQIANMQKLYEVKFLKLWPTTDSLIALEHKFCSKALASSLDFGDRSSLKTFHKP